jgi:hypothetical protein
MSNDKQNVPTGTPTSEGGEQSKPFQKKNQWNRRWPKKNDAAAKPAPGPIATPVPPAPQGAGVNISTRTQYPQKINTWAGIFNNDIIGPFEIDGNLNSATYLDLLVTKVGPALEEVARENQEI